MVVFLLINLLFQYPYYIDININIYLNINYSSSSSVYTLGLFCLGLVLGIFFKNSSKL